MHSLLDRQIGLSDGQLPNVIPRLLRVLRFDLLGQERESRASAAIEARPIGRTMFAIGLQRRFRRERNAAQKLLDEFFQ